MCCHLLWFLWFAASAEAQGVTPLISSVVAEEGASVVLPCHPIEQISKGHRRLSVHWSRDRSTMLLVDQSGVVKRGRNMVQRATIQESLFHKGIFSLQIQPVRYADAGLYKGSIEYGGRSLQCQVLLHVIKVAAEPSGILPETGNVSLTCSSTDLQEEKELRWYHNEDRISTNEMHVLRGKELTIRQLSKGHAGDWRCELLYWNGMKASASYHLQVLGFSHEDLNPPFVYAAVGSSSELPCHLSGITESNTEGVSVRWTWILSNGHEKSRSTSDSAILGSNSWSSRVSLLHGHSQNVALHISEVGQGDAGLYRCSFTYRGQTLTRTAMLVTMRVSSSKSGLIREGSVLQLTCDVSDMSEVQRYRWSQLEVALRNDSEDEYSSERSRAPCRSCDSRTLELSPVSLWDAGTWVCSIYGRDRILGQVKYQLDIIGAESASPSPTSSGTISFAVIFFFIVLLILVAIFFLTWRNRRRRLSHYPALENVGRLSPTPKQCPKAEVE